MIHFKVLIVEDEILIADNLKRFLTKKGHKVVGIAISYEEAVQLYKEQDPDIVLLDIQLNGAKSGIDMANFIMQQPTPKPFIFLTAQMDLKNIDKAKKTFPAGYLSKPVQKDSLFASLEIAMNQHTSKKARTTIPLYDGTKNHLVPINNILYLKSEHVYVKVYLHNQNYVMQRRSLKELLAHLPKDQFVQTHRSFVINTKRISHWDIDRIYINDKTIPISRSRRKETFASLKSN